MAAAVLILYVGDNPIPEVLGPLQAGLKVAWVNRFRAAQATDRRPTPDVGGLRSLSELLPPAPLASPPLSPFSLAFQRTLRAGPETAPGGVNSPVRAFRAVGGDPPVIASGRGSHIFDVDGNGYIDYVGSWGPLILGHAHPASSRVHRRRRRARHGLRRDHRAGGRAGPPDLRGRPLDRDGALRQLRHRGDDDRAAAGPRLHRPRRRSSSSRAATTATPTACW